ncbi:PP2C family protein-serine/threonine phosphatase [Microbacterium karelineae]|uniref:PP2C family protein-serine/threonine phosphatase n=1 Tax=Microbacterium karelineae TaxID=2654283 RepID=UPI0012E99D6F|nr:protein phosphatase 2C domain-containing protein [Microbacterium karelineae]
MGAAITTASGVATDAGRRRALNEDAALASWPCFLVADGMGGHDAGDVAAATALAAFQRFASREWVSVDDARGAVDAARSCLASFSRAQKAGAGTTLSGVIVTEVDGAGYWLALNVGDSRTYRLQAETLTQLTVDHSLVQELIDAGALSEEAARADRRRNVVTRALGAGGAGETDVWMLPAARGDRILVCTDGLTEELTAERIATVLNAEPDPRAAAARLVREAVQQGGRDNITVVVVDALDVARGGLPDDVDADTVDRGAWEHATAPRTGIAGSSS